MSTFMGLTTVAAFLAFLAVIGYAVFARSEQIDAAARAPLEDNAIKLSRLFVGHRVPRNF
jgi:hypothetical protein